ncbi:MAG: transposase [Albidovulum sp.]|nr:transposase [Albidovulum sp.]
MASALPEGVDLASVCLCFQDEARIGQKGMAARVRALRGTRPRVPRDHRYGYCYLFSAIFPEAGVAVGHICDRASTDEMNRHLLDIAASVPDGRHALVVLDGAGRHRSKGLEIPASVALRRLPPRSPELNPVETVFQFLKSRHFAN